MRAMKICKVLYLFTVLGAIWPYSLLYVTFLYFRLFYRYLNSIVNYITEYI